MFVFIDGTWHRITDVLDSGEIVIPANMATTGVTSGVIAGMNELEIVGEDIELSEFRISFNPRVL